MSRAAGAGDAPALVASGDWDAWPPPPPLAPAVEPGHLEPAAARLATACPGRLALDVPLGPLTTFRIGGPARLFLRAERLGDLAAVADALAEAPLPLLVLGRGSNLLVGDRGWPGLVVHLGTGFRGITRQGAELEAGAATPLPALAARSAAEGLAGMAFAVAIPGSVGGGVRMNAGAHGGEVGDFLRWAQVVPLTGEEAGRPRRIPVGALGLAYRRSALPAGTVVTAARFALRPSPEAAVRAAIDAARRWRREHQPVNQPNCGSVFANPDGRSAGEVVESLGMRGARVGGAAVSRVHANFIVAGAGARPVEVLALLRHAQRRAFEEQGVRLRTEVQLVGAFEDHAQLEVEEP